MPYISQNARNQLGDSLDMLLFSIGCCKDDELDGIANYVITRLLTGVYGRRYAAYVAMLGTLEAVKLELYRRLAAPYEDKKRAENGEVY